MNIGLIAGGGQFPLLFAEKAAQKGYQVHAAAFINEAEKELENFVQSIQWLNLGQLGRLVKFFKNKNITQAVMLGSIKKTRIFTDIKPDLKALTLIAKMGHTHDDGVLTRFADFLEKQGIKINPSTFLLPELISPKGFWTKKKPDKAEKKDIKIGWDIAKKIGDLDIGQSIVIGNGTVLAVEAADGTDATIKRGAKLCKGNAIVIKCSKPNQDLRFDVPASGINTIKTMYESGACVLVLEAEKTISFDRQEMIELADKLNISIVAL